MKPFSSSVVGAIVLVACWVTPTILCAAVSQGRQLEIVRMGFAAASLAVAESDTATSANPSAGLYNAATGIGCSGTQLSSMHNHPAADVDLFSLGVVQGLGDQWTVGGNWLQYQITEIPVTAVENATATQDVATTRASYSVHAINGFVATKVLPNWDIGVAGTLLVSHLSSDLGGSGYGFSLSPGVRSQLSPNVAVGAYIENVVSTMVWQSGTHETFDPMAHLSAEYRVESWVTSVDYALTTRRLLDGDLKIGIQYPIFPFLTVGVGMYSSHFNCGFGAKLGSVVVDYAYLGGGIDRLDDGSRVTVGIRL